MFATLLIGLYMTCVPAANWMIGNVGTHCVPSGPCLIPVAPGVEAPSGVLMVGLALVLRDVVQRKCGKAPVLAAILAGTALSFLVAPPAVAVASCLAFLLSELADFAVYTPLEKKRLILAVFASSVVGLVIDSVVFLLVAFGSVEFLAGQVIGKGWMVVLALPFIRMMKAREERLDVA